MPDNTEAMVWASLAGDSLALGVHWNYDAAALARDHGRVEEFLPPGPTFHPNKNKGDFTHYGDQTMVLLESLAESGRFDLADWAARWRKLFDGYKGYYDKATKAALAKFENNAPPEKSGSSSDDFSGASRIAPLFPAHAGNLTDLVQAARAQAAMTHNSSATIESADFFARVGHAVLGGASPKEAMNRTAASFFSGGQVEAWVRRGLDSLEGDTVEVIGQFGRACPAGMMFSGVVHILAKYEDDLREGLVQSVMAGGDNAARSMMVGLILGARNGLKALPAEWMEGLNQKDRVQKFMDRLAG